MKKNVIVFLIAVCCVFFLVADLLLHYHHSSFVQFRIPRIIAAILCGAGLSASGSALQVYFRNPLAGPYVTGITPGATLGVAIISMTGITQFLNHFLQDFSIALIAIFSGTLVFLLQIILSKKIPGNYSLLLLGIIIGFFISAIIEIIETFSAAEQLKNYVQWGMGNFARVTIKQLPVFCALIVLGIYLLFVNRKKCNAYLPGDLYAQNAGVNLTKFRNTVIFSSALLAGVCTAFCGPIGFVGMITPQLAKIILNTGTYKNSFFLTILLGILFCLIADLLANNLIPNIQFNINPVISIFGAPIFIYIMLKNKIAE